jgi:hypothetical protein
MSIDLVKIEIEVPEYVATGIIDNAKRRELTAPQEIERMYNAVEEYEIDKKRMMKIIEDLTKETNGSL